MKPYQIILFIVGLLLWVELYRRRWQSRRRQKMNYFLELHSLIVEYIRDEADRLNIGDATTANTMIECCKLRSFCKKTEELIEELCQQWLAKFAHLYNQ